MKYLSIILIIAFVLGACGETPKEKTKEELLKEGKPNPEEVKVIKDSKVKEGLTEEPKTIIKEVIVEVFESLHDGLKVKLGFYAQKSAIAGTVENTTGKAFKNVVVNVELSDGSKLAPVTFTSLNPGQKENLSFEVKSKKVKSFEVSVNTGLKKIVSDSELKKELSAEKEALIKKKQAEEKTKAIIKEKKLKNMQQNINK